MMHAEAEQRPPCIVLRQRFHSQSCASSAALLVTASRASQILERSGPSTSSVCRMDSSWRDTGELLTCTSRKQSQRLTQRVVL